MRLLGSFPVFAALMAVALGMVLLGAFAVFSRDVSSLLGFLLIVAGLRLQGAARRARAAYVHRSELERLAVWAQDLGPRSRKGGR